MDVIEESTEINGQRLTLQVGKLANSATTSVFARLGDTCVLVTVTLGNEREDIDYFPLFVEYVEKLYAGGRIKGSRWVKREGKPSDEAVLKARLVDRSIRPLFPKNYRREIQIIITLLSVDGINPPDILAAIGTSAALHISSIPWEGPMSMVRIGYVKSNGGGNFLVNPTEEEEKFSVMDLIVASRRKKVVMIEAKAEEVEEKVIIEGIKTAKAENNKIIDFIEELRKKVGRPKEELILKPVDQKLLTILKKEYGDEIERSLLNKVRRETEEKKDMDEIVESVLERYKDEFEKKEIIKAIDYLNKQLIKEKVFKEKVRVDGRKPEEIREIYVETSILPRTHGSAIFQRGNTQVLSIVTLGSPHLEQLIEGPEGEEAKRYIHHYYMPPYSVGEVGRLGYPSRREIGHGALAEKALEPVLPTEEEFPYTIRVVSEVLSSNGSTSMASVCGSTLALMDAGVPIKSMVAGIAMGLMSRSDNEYVILTDIMGLEDFSGEMDFKIAGSVKGVTAIQLDVKNNGLTDEIIKAVFKRGREARLYILDKMRQVIAQPRREISRFAPKVVVINPPQEKIGDIIGPGGKNIRNLIARTETDIDVSNDGQVVISGLDKKKVEEAVQLINNIIREIKLGEEFYGEVKRILPFGAIVELFPGKEGLVHVSKMGVGYVRNPRDVVKVKQKVRVKVIQIDPQGRVNLQLLPQN